MQKLLQIVLSACFVCSSVWAKSNLQIIEGSRQRPSAPAISQPANAPGRYVELDISQYSAGKLEDHGSYFYENGDYQQSAQNYYWSIQNGGTAFYELACSYALSGDVDAAIYWLYVNAQKGNPDVQGMEQDKDLANVHASKTWPALRSYTESMQTYWAESGNKAYQVITPDAYKPGTAVPVIVGLHGLGGTPSTFIHKRYQELADQMNAVFIAISGPKPLGADAYGWTTDAKVNEAHVSNLLSLILKKEKIKPSSKALIGLSQGAQVSLQVAVNTPDQWSGALAMSPGLSPVQSIEIHEPKALDSLRVIVTNGDKERPYNLKLAENNIALLKQGGAQVEHIVYPNHGHRYPPDYYQNIQGWLQHLLKLDK